MKHTEQEVRERIAQLLEARVAGCEVDDDLEMLTAYADLLAQPAAVPDGWRDASEEKPAPLVEVMCELESGFKRVGRFNPNGGGYWQFAEFLHRSHNERNKYPPIEQPNNKVTRWHSLALHAAPQPAAPVQDYSGLVSDALHHAGLCSSYSAKLFNLPPDEVSQVEAGDRLLRAAQLLVLLARAVAQPSQAEPQQAEPVAVAPNPPYSNCQFRICDLPGQCRGEGKCHHPVTEKPAPAPGPLTDERALFEAWAGSQLLIGNSGKLSPSGVIALAAWQARAALSQVKEAAVALTPGEDEVGLLEYKGNSVAYIYQKMRAYRSGIDEAWDALREVGHSPDGSTRLCDKIRAALAQQGRDAERYRFVKTMTKEQLLLWRGAYGMSDEAIDAAIAANGGA